MIKKKKQSKSSIPILNLPKVHKKQISIDNLINKTKLESPQQTFRKPNHKTNISYGMGEAILEIQNKLEESEIESQNF
jgi:hypothetical protein